MGLFKIIYYALTTISIMFLTLNYLPNLLDIEPQAYTPKLLKFEGALAVNKDLDKGKIILENEVFAPESLVLRNGEIYVSTVTGKILKIKNDKVVKTVVDTGGYPLGLRIYKDELYVADIKKGVLKINIETGKTTVLVDPMESIAGKKNNYPNDLDVHDGVVYFTVVSTKWNVANAFYGMIEHENSGRVCKHDLATGKTEVLVEGVYGANGLQVTNDKTALIFSEIWNSRILRYYLSGSKKGKTEVFVELPGEPDNIRPSSTGGYWIAMVTSRDVNSPELLDRLGPYPKIRKALARLSYLLGHSLSWVNQYIASPVLEEIVSEFKFGTHFLLLKDVHHPIVVEVDDSGKIVRSFHSTNPKFAFLSQGLEHDGYLYLGSFKNPYMVKLKL